MRVDDLHDAGAHLVGDLSRPAAAPGGPQRLEPDVVELVDHAPHPVTRGVQSIGNLRSRVTASAHDDDLGTTHRHRRREPAISSAQ